MAEVSRQTGVPESSTLRYDLNKVRARLPETLANRRPGPKPQERTPAAAQPPESDERPAACPECQGRRIWKNGTYWVLNWVAMLLMGWQGIQHALLQRWRCAECGKEIPSLERQRQALARQIWWQVVQRLIGLSRFKLGLSTRKTQILVGFVYARHVSLGYIEGLSQRIGKRAQGALAKLSQCRQGIAQFFLLYDETFPKLKERAYSLGVAICEHGLIRSVRCVTQKAKDIPVQLREVVGGHFQPSYFLTDLDVLYNKYMQDADLDLIHLRDRVHLIRQIVRLFDEAIRDTTLDVPKGLPLKERKKQHKLKRRLLRKRLRPLLDMVFKAFSPGYESVCVLILEGVISQLQDPDIIPQTASVQTLARRLQRLLNKHGDTINLLLQLSVEQGTPTTTNALESKNSIFKPFSRIAKFFPVPKLCQEFYSAVALMENFDVKTRGPNAGTNAMQRAQIDLKDFGASDFFSAVGLPKPQISLACITD